MVAVVAAAPSVPVTPSEVPATLEATTELEAPTTVDLKASETGVAKHLGGLGLGGFGYPGFGRYPGFGYPGFGYPGFGYPGFGYPGFGGIGGFGYPGFGYPGFGHHGFLGWIQHRFFVYLFSIFWCNGCICYCGYNQVKIHSNTRTSIFSITTSMKQNIHLNKSIFMSCIE